MGEIIYGVTSFTNYGGRKDDQVILKETQNQFKSFYDDENYGNNNDDESEY